MVCLSNAQFNMTCKDANKVAPSFRSANKNTNNVNLIDTAIAVSILLFALFLLNAIGILSIINILFALIILLLIRVHMKLKKRTINLFVL